VTSQCSTCLTALKQKLQRRSVQKTASRTLLPWASDLNKARHARLYLGLRQWYSANLKVQSRLFPIALESFFDYQLKTSKKYERLLQWQMKANLTAMRRSSAICAIIRTRWVRAARARLYTVSGSSPKLSVLIPTGESTTADATPEPRQKHCTGVGERCIFPEAQACHPSPDHNRVSKALRCSRLGSCA